MSLLFSHKKRECSKIWKPSSEPESIEAEASPKISRNNLVEHKECSTSARKSIIQKTRIKLKPDSKSDSRIDEKLVSSKESVSRRYKISKIFTYNLKKFATGVCVPFVDISLRASFYSASHFSTETRARKFAWPLKRHTV